MNRSYRIFFYFWNAIATIGLLIMFFYLPHTIPTEWNHAGEVINRANKGYAFISCILPALVWLGFEWLPVINHNDKKQQHKYIRNELLIVYIAYYLSFTTLIAAAEKPFSLAQSSPIIPAIFFLTIANTLLQKSVSREGKEAISKWYGMTTLIAGTLLFIYVILSV